MDSSTVSVIGVVGDQGIVQSPVEPTEEKPKKDKASTSQAKKTTETKSATDSKIAELDQKWSDRFNCLEALFMAKIFQPTSSSAKVTPTHSPPGSIVKDNEPSISSERTGTDFSASEHQSTSQLKSG